VIVTDLTFPHETEKMIGPTAHPFQLDVTQEEDWRSLSVKSRDIGEVDIVVNNAGYFPNHPILLCHGSASDSGLDHPGPVSGQGPNESAGQDGSLRLSFAKIRKRLSLSSNAGDLTEQLHVLHPRPYQTEMRAQNGKSGNPKSTETHQG